MAAFGFVADDDDDVLTVSLRPRGSVLYATMMLPSLFVSETSKDYRIHTLAHTNQANRHQHKSVLSDYSILWNDYSKSAVCFGCPSTKTSFFTTAKPCNHDVSGLVESLSRIFNAWIRILRVNYSEHRFNFVFKTCCACLQAQPSDQWQQ